MHSVTDMGAPSLALPVAGRRKGTANLSGGGATTPNLAPGGP